MTDRKRTLHLIFWTIFISMVGFGIVIPVLPIYAKDAPFKLSPTQLGWLVGCFSLVQLVSGPLIGKLSDRVGRRPVLLISIIGTAIGYFVTGAAFAPWMLFLGRIIDGASGGNIATAQACIADVTPPQDRSKAMGHIGAAFGLGFIFGPAIGGVLSHHFGVASPFYFAGALSMLNAVFVYARLPETLSEDKRLHPTEKGPLSEVFAEGRASFITLLLIATLLSTTGFASIHLLFALFCQDHVGYTLQQTSYAFAYVGFIAVLVQGGLLRRLLKRDGAEKPVALTGAALLALSLWLMPRTTSNTSFLLVNAVMALGNGLLVPTLSGMTSRHVHGRAQGRVLGLSQAAGSLGRFLGPALAALPLPALFSEASRPLTGELLASVNRGYEVAFTAAAVMILAALVVVAVMKPLEIESPGEENAAPAT
jgi:DHA1 family tetracycline resistance protein-like MFS transporter